MVSVRPERSLGLAWITDLGGRLWDRSVDDAGVTRQLEALLSFADAVDAARAISTPTASQVGFASDNLLSHLCIIR